MSEKPILSQSLPELLALRRKKNNLTSFHLTFLTNWYDLIAPKMFGFRGVRTLPEQLDRAIKLLKDTEKDWEIRVRENQISLPFYKYMFYTAVSEGVDLPNDFEDRFVNQHKGDIK